MPDYATARTAMVDSQVRPSDVTLYPIIAAMLEVPREIFVPVALRDVAYAGTHLPLARGRVVMDPRVIAKMLDALKPGPEELVLDIAPGLGYSSALLARLAAAVVAVEEDEALARGAQDALSTAGADTVVVEHGPHAAGAPDHGPFDAVFVNGGIEELPPAIVAQIKPGGRCVAIFMEGNAGKCRLGIRSGDRMTWKTVFDATAPVLSGFEKCQKFVF